MASFTNNLKRRAVISTVLLAILAVQISCAAAVNELSALQENVLRLHIIANSNHPADQELKLKVRDAVLVAMSGLLDGVKTREEAVHLAQTNLPLIIQTAEEVVRRAGMDYKVKAAIEWSTFPEKKYGELTLPGGDYKALKVVLGEGKGRNWWCVLFPPLCLIDASAELQKGQTGSVAEAAASLTGATVTDESVGQGPQIVYRLAIVELLRSLCKASPENKQANGVADVTSPACQNDLTELQISVW